MGKRSKVKIVDEKIPPVTTVASGLCTSAPIPVENIIGRKPNMATRAVMITGLSLDFVASIIIVRPLFPSAIDEL